MSELPAARPRARVVLVSRLPPPWGGISTWTRIVLDRGLAPGWEAKLVDARLPRARRPFDPPRAGIGEALRTLRILRDLLLELALRRPALVHVNVGSFELGLVRDALAAWLCRARGVPVVLHVHGDAGRLTGSGASRVGRAALRWAARAAARVVVLNESSRGAVASIAGAGCAIASLPNFFDPAELPDPASVVRARPLRVAFVGGVTRAKGAPEVLAVAGRVPEAEFHLFGSADEALAPALAAAPPNVVARGELGHGALLRELAASTLLLFPSHEEGFPYAVLEAAALGLPVVATPVGAIPDIVEAGRGALLAPVGDDAALTEAVRALLGDPERARAFGLANRERAHRLFAFDAVAPRLTALYDEVVADARR